MRAKVGCLRHEQGWRTGSARWCSAATAPAKLAGISPATGAAAGYRQGVYTSEHTEQTYATLLERTERLLGLGETVLLDASWTSEHHWRAARTLAGRTHSTVRELRCVARPHSIAARLAHRAGNESDANPAVAAAMGHGRSWPEASDVDTDQLPDASVERALSAVVPPAHR